MNLQAYTEEKLKRKDTKTKIVSQGNLQQKCVLDYNVYSYGRFQNVLAIDSIRKDQAPADINALPEHGECRRNRLPPPRIPALRCRRQAALTIRDSASKPLFEGMTPASSISSFFCSFFDWPPREGLSRLRHTALHDRFLRPRMLLRLLWPHVCHALSC